MHATTTVAPAASAGEQEALEIGIEACHYL